jgi:cytochrome c oxidase assembly protein subunit 15
LGRSEAELMTARRGREAQAVQPVHRADAFRLSADPAGRAGGGDRRWPGLSDLALDERQFFPADAFYVPDGRRQLPVWHAFFENPGLVQFIHRMSGYLLFAFGVVVWLRGRKSAYQATRGPFMR